MTTKLVSHYGWPFAGTSRIDDRYQGLAHTGDDYVWVVYGQKVESLGAGVVVAKGKGYIFGYAGYGHWILIKHDDGKYVFYAHLASVSILRRVGTRVAPGQGLGKASLLWTHISVMREKFDRGTLIDPTPYFNTRRSRYAQVRSTYESMVRKYPSVKRAEHLVNLMGMGEYDWDQLDRYLKSSKSYKKLHPTPKPKPPVKPV